MGNQGLFTAQGYDPNVSPAGELHHTAEPRGLYSNSSTRRQRYASLGESDLWTDFHEGMLACASPTSHSEKDNHESMTHSANCAPAGASGC